MAHKCFNFSEFSSAQMITHHCCRYSDQDKDISSTPKAPPWAPVITPWSNHSSDFCQTDGFCFWLPILYGACTLQLSIDPTTAYCLAFGPALFFALPPNPSRHVKLRPLLQVCIPKPQNMARWASTSQSWKEPTWVVKTYCRHTKCLVY